MSRGFWKRAGVGLLAGALAAVVAWPLASLAASPGVVASVLPPEPRLAQHAGGSQQCQALGGGGLTGMGLQQGGLGQVFTFGAGGFYGPYYNPAYSSFGLGTVGTFLDFRNGQPSPLATLSGSPYCQGLGIVAPAPAGNPFIVRDFGISNNPIFGFSGAGFGPLGGSPFGAGGFSPFGFGFR